MTAGLVRDRRLRIRLLRSTQNDVYQSPGEFVVKHFSIYSPHHVRNRHAGDVRSSKALAARTLGAHPVRIRTKQGNKAALRLNRIPHPDFKREWYTRFPALTFAQVLYPNYTSLLTPANRDMIWHAILRDAEYNRTLKEQGLLQAFANPEHAAAAYEISLERLDFALHNYRYYYKALINGILPVYTVVVGGGSARAERIRKNVRLLRLDRQPSSELTKEVKDTAKVLNAIVARDTLHSENVLRLSAFKLNYHRAMNGWSVITNLVHDPSDTRLPRFVLEKLNKAQLTWWRRDIAKAKQEVKLLLDDRLREPQLPLYHFKKTLDFLHDTVKFHGGSKNVMEELVSFYSDNFLFCHEYYTKALWMQAWYLAFETMARQTGEVFRSVNFFISAHIRAKYNYQEVAFHVKDQDNDLPIYVREGLRLQSYRHALPPVPFPKIRPDLYGTFDKSWLNFNPKGAMYSDVFDVSALQEQQSRAIVTALQAQPGLSVDAQNISSVSPPQIVETSTGLEVEGISSVDEDEFEDAYDQSLLEDDDGLPDADADSFSSSHKSQNYVYGMLLRQAKVARHIQQAQKADLAGLKGRSKQSKTHLYAALLRDSRGSLPVDDSWQKGTSMEMSTDSSAPVVRQWHASYMRRSVARPNNYGMLLSRFKGSAPLTPAVPSPSTSQPALPPSRRTPESEITAVKDLDVTRSTRQDYLQPKLVKELVSVAADYRPSNSPEFSIYNKIIDRVLVSNPPVHRPRRARRVVSFKFARLPNEEKVDIEYAPTGNSSNKADPRRVKDRAGAGMQDVRHDSAEQSPLALTNEFKPSTLPETPLKEYDNALMTKEQDSAPWAREQMNQAQAEEMFRYVSTTTASTFDVVQDNSQQDDQNVTSEQLSTRAGQDVTAESLEQSADRGLTRHQGGKLNAEPQQKPTTPAVTSRHDVNLKQVSELPNMKSGTILQSKMKAPLTQGTSQYVIKTIHLAHLTTEPQDDPHQNATRAACMSSEDESANHANQIGAFPDKTDVPKLSDTKRAIKWRRLRAERAMFKELVRGRDVNSNHNESSEDGSSNHANQITPLVNWTDNSKRSSSINSFKARKLRGEVAMIRAMVRGRDVDSNHNTPAPTTASSNLSQQNANNINQEVLRELLSLRQEMAKMREEMSRMTTNIAKGDAPPPIVIREVWGGEAVEKREAVRRVVSEIYR